MSSQRWVLFDLDGTLFDYVAAETAAVTATLADAGLPVDEGMMASYREINARHWGSLERGETTPAALRLDRWHDLFALHQPCGEVPVEVIAQRYLGHLSRGTQLIDGAVEIVVRVGRTHRIGFVTNGLADVQRPRLAASGLDDLAEVVVISDEVGAAKPDPAFLDAAFARMGSPSRGEVTLIGDSLSADIAAGVAYGLTTVWIDPHGVELTSDEPRPDHRIASLDEIPALLGV